MHKPDQLCGVSAKENATFIGAFCVCVCVFLCKSGNKTVDAQTCDVMAIRETE